MPVAHLRQGFGELWLFDPARPVLVVSFEDALPLINALEQRLKLAHIDRARIIGVVHL